jgi:hypothetical protein
LFFRTLDKLGVDEARIATLKTFLDLQTDDAGAALLELRRALRRT